MGARGPKPGAKRAKAAEAAAAAPAVAAVAVAPPAPAPAAQQPPARAEVPPAVESRDSLQRGRNIDTMPEAELRRYARQIGLSQRDAEGLGVERLRQNCAAQLYELIEDL